MDTSNPRHSSDPSPEINPKRRHTSAAGAAFKSPPPPPPATLKPSPTETLFRILCPAVKTGGIIGKGGAIIRQIREQTGAKIRIEDPVSGSDDRVIAIVADAQTKRNGDGKMEGDASSAQKALVRVFERTLNVEEGDADVVLCRLLVLSGEVGRVLGKGGKIVEKIRQESGAQIRILPEEHVPVCAAAGDELIHITGSSLAVRKALLSVSSCLQDNPRTELTNFTTTKPFAATRGTGPPLMGDPYSQKSYPSQEYHPMAYSNNPGIDAATSSYRKVPEEEVVFRMLCTNDKVGIIIGKGGVIIRALQSETGAAIKVVASDSDERIIVISAREHADLNHSPAQEAVLRVNSRLAEAGNDRGSAISSRLFVPTQQIGCLLGKGGAIIAEMRRATGASIRIFSKDQVPKCAQPNDEIVQVTGTFESVQDALLQITGRIRETIFSLKHYGSAGATPHMSAAPEIPPALLRTRYEPTSTSLHSTVGLSCGRDSPVSFYGSIDRQAPLSHGMDRNIADRVPFSYSGEGPGFHAPYDHSSPKSWPPEVVGGNSRGIPDGGIGVDFRSGVAGSGSQATAVTSTTIRVLVPQNLLAFVYGEDGSNLTEIREISGAKVMIYDPEAGTTEGKVIISGTSEQTRTAQSLLHAFIFCGQASS